MITDTTSVLPRESSGSDAAIGSSELPSVLAVVVTHNGRTWLRDCLVALANQTYEHLDVLVVDDASPHPREEPRLKRIVKRHLRRRRWGFLRTPRSLGYGAAINWALSRVRTDADFLLFLHDDAALAHSSVEEMVEHMLGESNAAMVGPKIVSWDDPKVLEEVGMAIDRFGYPYKGLEHGEIDLGQHDRASEVFYVTSTVMLVRHDVFKRMRGFDSRLGAYSEDLDLCWRARLLGHSVRIEPDAVARHAIAMATGQRRTRFGPPRYFIRRNRLRTIIKNASTLRLLGLIPLFVFLSVGEMLSFLVLREPREVGNLFRALLWNLFHSPQTLTERRRVQRARRVPDKTLTRLMVKLPARLRVYALDQAERLEEGWGRRAEYLSSRTTQARALSATITGWRIAAAVAVLALVVAGFRDLFWAPAASYGEILPFPDGATSLWRQWASPWQDAGLGRPGPAPTSFLLLGLVQFVSFGAAGAAQKLLFLLLGRAAGFGAWRLVAELVDRPARLAAGAVYVLGAVGYAGLRTGSLGALAFGAAAPYVLLSILRLIGWTRPARWSAGREVATLALFAAISGAFVPGSLLLLLGAALLLVGVRSLVGPPGTELKALGGCALGLALGWALLLPWSFGWAADGGPLSDLVEASSSLDLTANFRGQGMISVVLGQTPAGPVLSGLALPVLGGAALLAAGGQRRRSALALWSLVVGIGFLTTATATGIVPPIVASPVEMGVLAALAFSGLAGLAVGAFRLDLPRRKLGVAQVVTVAALAAALFLFGAGLAPGFFGGAWAPGKGTDRIAADQVDRINALLATEGAGEFRALWIGERWTSTPASGRLISDRFLSGRRGSELTDHFSSEGGPARMRLREVVDSIEVGATDRGGSLVGSFNIRFVIVDAESSTRPWLSQRDLALIRIEDDFLVFQDQSALERAALYNQLPPYVAAIEEEDPALASEGVQIERAEIEREGPSSYERADLGGPGVVFLAESAHEGWNASVGHESLERVESGWGNAFDVPGDAAGRVSIDFDRSIGDVVWLVAVPLVWVFMVGAAFPSRRSEAHNLRSRRA